MARANLKPNSVIIAEMMKSGAGSTRAAIGSHDPGPEFVARAHRAVDYAIAQANAEFKYPRSDYPFAQSDASKHYRDSFDVQTGPRGVKIENDAPSALLVEDGRGAVRARNGGYLRLPLKSSARLRGRGRGIPGNRAFVAEYGGRKYLFTKKVRESDGYGIIMRAIQLSFSR